MSPIIAREMNELAGQLGIATLLFFSLLIVSGVLLVYIRSQARQTEEYIRVQAREAEQQKEKDKQIYMEIIETIRQDREKDQTILMSTLEDNRQQINMLRTVVERMRTHEQAVQVLLNKTSQILENRCAHHLTRKS